MAEFQPPEIEQAYKLAAEGLVPQLGLWDRVPEAEELDDLQRSTDALLAELRADGMTQHPHYTMRDGPEHLKYRANQYVGMDSQN